MLDHADRIDTTIGLPRAQHFTVIGYVIGGCAGTIVYCITSYFDHFQLMHLMVYSMEALLVVFLAASLDYHPLLLGISVLMMIILIIVLFL